jgi:antimicrobial peptide system SdpA family protein
MNSATPGPGEQPGPTPPSNRSLGLAFLGLLGATLVVAGLVFQVNQVENVLTTQWQRSLKPVVVAILPQQWGFFTKSGREPTMTALTSDPDGNWTNATAFPFGQPEHWFGWDRGVRAEGIEIGLIHSSVAQGEWTACDPGTSAADCAASIASDASSAPLRAINTTPSPQICGNVMLLNIEPAPWAFARIGQGQPMHEGLWVDVQCSKD